MTAGQNQTMCLLALLDSFPTKKNSSIIRVQGLGMLAPAFENHMEEKNMDNKMEAGAE